MWNNVKQFVWRFSQSEHRFQGTPVKSTAYILLQYPRQLMNANHKSSWSKFITKCSDKIIKMHWKLLARAKKITGHLGTGNGGAAGTVQIVLVVTLIQLSSFCSKVCAYKENWCCRAQNFRVLWLRPAPLQMCNYLPRSQQWKLASPSWTNNTYIEGYFIFTQSRVPISILLTFQ